MCNKKEKHNVIAFESEQMPKHAQENAHRCETAQTPQEVRRLEATRRVENAFGRLGLAHVWSGR